MEPIKDVELMSMPSKNQMFEEKISENIRLKF